MAGVVEIIVFRNGGVVEMVGALRLPTLHITEM